MKIYAVGLHLSQKILTGYLGLSDYVICYAQAITDIEACEKAARYYTGRYNLSVIKKEAWLAKEQDPQKYIEPDKIIK